MFSLGYVVDFRFIALIKRLASVPSSPALYPCLSLPTPTAAALTSSLYNQQYLWLFEIFIRLLTILWSTCVSPPVAHTPPIFMIELENVHKN